MRGHEHLTRRLKISLRKDILTDDYFQLTFVIGLFFLFLFSTSYFICPNASGGSAWKTTTDLDFNATGRIFNHTIINGTGIGANIQLESVADWWPQNINAPPSRVDFAMAALGNDDKIILFGGYTGLIRLNDTWMYDLSDNKWTQIYPSNAPSPRDSHAMATVYNDDKVILFGGFYTSGTEPRTNYNDTWTYDYSDNQWYNISTSFSPSPRCAHSMARIETTSEILLYGGFSDALWELSDTWIFNVSTLEWRQINSTNKPSAHIDCKMTNIWNEGKILLFGGRGGSQFFNETWIFDQKGNNWSEIYPLVSPSARTYIAMATLTNSKKVLLFGGHDGNSWLCETWVYDSLNNLWNQTFPPDFPISSDDFNIVPLYGTNRLVLIGGYNQQTWIYYQSAYSQFGEYISPYYDTGGPSIFTSICWTASIPINTSIEFRLKTGLSQNDLESKPFIGPDGTLSSFYINGNNLSELAQGHHWIQYFIKFNTKEPTKTPVIYDVMINYDRIPCCPIHNEPANASWLNISRPIFRWTPNDSDSIYQTAFELQIKGFVHSDWFEYSSGEIETINNLYVSNFSLDDGTWYWRVRTRDPEGNWGNFNNFCLFGIDTITPDNFKINVTPNIWTARPIEIQFITYDNLSGIDYYSLSIDKVSMGNITSPYQIPQLTEGKHELIVCAHDRADNQKNSSIKIYIDRSPPEPFNPIIDALSWTNISPTITFSTVDLVSGIHHFEIEVDDGPFLTEISPYNLPELSDGEHNIFIRAFDIAGNYRDAILKAFIDTILPTDLLFSITPDGWTNLDPTITYSASDSLSGIDHYEIKINNGQFFEQQSPLTLTGLQEGHNIITIIVFDKAGNYIVGQLEALIDRTPPKEFKPISTEANWTRVLPKISFSTNDSISGIRRYKMKIDDGQFENVCSPMTPTITIDGCYNITIRAYDNAGNYIDGALTVLYDSSSPIIISVKINGGIKSTTSHNITISISAMDNTSGIDKMCFSNDGLTFSSWESFSKIKHWTITTGEEKKTIYIKLKDNAGNEVMEESTITLTNGSDSRYLFITVTISLLCIIMMGFLLFKIRKSH